MQSSDTSCEPMDVDLSAQSANLSCSKDDVSFAESFPTVTPVTAGQNIIKIKTEVVEDESLRSQSSSSNTEVRHINKFHINMGTHKSTNPYIRLMVIPLLVLCISLYFALEIKCSDELDLTDLKAKLTNRVYGQTTAMSSLIQALEVNVDSKIIFFYGGTGVGKTFTSSLILENIRNASNVYHFTMPTFVNTFSIDTMLGINICKTSIVLVDDLNQNDSRVKKIIANIIDKSESLKKKITVILIYNCDVISKDLGKKCDESFSYDLEDFFKDINVFKKLIRFEPLSNNILRKCIESQINGRKLSDADFDNILSNFDVALDGCKGVYKKINILNLS